MRKFTLLAGLAMVPFMVGQAVAADTAVGSYETASRSWYVEVRGGGAVPVEHGFSSAATGPGEYEPDTGFNIGVDIGKYLTDNWRAELGLYWNRGSDGSATLGGGAPIAHAGDVNVYSVMGNLLYSFDTGSNLRPYLGAGIGFSHCDFDNLGAVGGAFAITGSDTVFSAALLSGLDLKVGERTHVTTRYSLAWADGGNYSTTTPGLTVTTSGEVEHIFGIGLRVDLH